MPALRQCLPPEEGYEVTVFKDTTDFDAGCRQAAGCVVAAGGRYDVFCDAAAGVGDFGEFVRA